MTAHLSFCKAARSVCRSSTSHGGTRPTVHLSPRIRKQLLELDAIHQPFSARATDVPLAAPARTQSASSPATLKSP
jgi:hypothetical protein